jgi:hypothetical protein
MFNQAERLAGTLGYLGSEGWELAAVYDKASNWLDGFEKGFLLFKRAVPDGQEPDGGWSSVSKADDLARLSGVLPPGECACGFQNPVKSTRCLRCHRALSRASR